jgi:hypothetical protein
MAEPIQLYSQVQANAQAQNMTPATTNAEKECNLFEPVDVHVSKTDGKVYNIFKNSETGRKAVLYKEPKDNITSCVMAGGGYPPQAIINDNLYSNNESKTLAESMITEFDSLLELKNKIKVLEN